MLNQMFTARRGKGAFLNGEQIHVSDITKLSESLVIFEYGLNREANKMENVFENQKKLVPLVHGLRQSGLNMAMVALGGIDAYVEMEIHIWDIAAGELIAREAGGVLIDPAGGDLQRFSRRVLCASSQELAEKLSREIVQFYPEPEA